MKFEVLCALPEGGVHCFTSASFAYLDRARVLAETVRRHHPEWMLWLCLVDEPPPGFDFDPGAESFDRIVHLSELGIPDWRSWAFGHDVVELCTAVKGPMLHRLLTAEGAERVIYLDPDIALFARLDPVLELLEAGHSVVLTPHLTTPEEQRQAILDNEIGALKHGIYNLGFLAVRGCEEGKRFAAWWRDRLLEFCHDDIPSGLFTDQRWCDHVPSFFPGHAILRDPGCNVASWNLSRRPLEIDEDGVIRAGGAVLRFFHFTKVNSVGETMLERYSGGRTAVWELVRWYRARLAAHAAEGLPEGWWAYGRYADGRPIAREHRLAWRARPDLRARFADPFASGPGTFQEWATAGEKTRPAWQSKALEVARRRLFPVARRGWKALDLVPGVKERLLPLGIRVRGMLAAPSRDGALVVGRGARHGGNLAEGTAASPRRPQPALLDAAALEAALSAERAGAGDGGLVLALSHDDYTRVPGGVQNVIGDEARALCAAGWTYLHARPSRPIAGLADHGPGEVVVSLIRDGRPLGEATVSALVAVLARAARRRPVRLIVHHLMGFRPEDATALAAAAGPGTTLMWLHDSFVLCAGYALLRNDLVPCGGPAPDSGNCGICLHGIGRAEHLRRMAAFLDAARPALLTPSAAALAQLKTGAASARLRLPRAEVAPLARIAWDAPRRAPRPPSPGRPLRIAFLGMPVHHKGWPVFAELARRYANDSRYVFLLLGAAPAASAPPGLRHVKVQVGPGDRDAMRRAVEEAGVDAVVVWPLVSETFSFVTREALAGGAFVIARRGAGNVWPAVEAEDPALGLALEDEAALFALFAEGGALAARIAAAPRRYGRLVAQSPGAEWVLEQGRAAPAGLAPAEARA